METKTLYCKKGKHEWSRPAQKGRAPHNCPEHSEVKTNSGMSGLEKAQAVRREKRVQEEKEWAKKIEAVINDPRMTYATPFWGDSRESTVSKLRYIQDQLQNNRRGREQHEIADLERMRERIMRDPFSRTGHLL